MKQSATICILLLLTGKAAFAHLNLPPPSPKTPCVTDYRRFCDDITPGQGRLFACMDANMPKLTPACRTEIQLEESSHARVEAIKAKLRAKQISEGKKPDPLLDPTPIGFRPGEYVPEKKITHVHHKPDSAVVKPAQTKAPSPPDKQPPTH